MHRVAAAVSAVTIALGGAIAFAGPSTAQDPPLPDAGAITLRTGSTQNFGYAPGAIGPAEATQRIRNGCNATSPGFIGVTGTTGDQPLPGDSACFGSLGFGVGSGGSPFYLRPNTAAAQGEALVLTLAGALATFEFATFDLDIEAANAPSGSTAAAEILLDVRDSSTGVLLQEGIPLQVDGSTRVADVRLPNFRIPETAIATPGNQLVFRPQGKIRFQLEGDTNNIGSIFKVTDVPDVQTIPVNGSAELTDDSGATATIINQGGASVPYVQQDCLPTSGEECVEFKLLGGEFYRLAVFASVPVDEADDQEDWDGLIDFDGTGFELGELDADCEINEANLTPQACITQFFYPDPKDGSGNPALAGDTSEIEYRTDVWDLYVQDPKLR